MVEDARLWAGMVGVMRAEVDYISVGKARPRNVRQILI